jgi:heme exporter protein C
MTTRLDRITPILNWLAVGLVVICMFMIFFYAPDERSMGHVQRILYFHVGSAWVALITFLAALIAGVQYLRRPSRDWDTVAVASVEIGVIFTTITIISGSVWAKPAWNTWWIWSPRLTLIVVMWLTYVAYFMLRNAIEDVDKRRRFAAIYVILAFVTVILTYASIRILRDIHPVIVGPVAEAAQGIAQGEQDFAPGLAAKMRTVLYGVATPTFIAIYAAWLANRMRLQRMIDRTSAVKAQVMARLQHG